VILSIEVITSAKESLIHLLVFIVVGVPLRAATFLEIDALVIALMIVAFFIPFNQRTSESQCRRACFCSAIDFT
jgi:hypothetical protein